MSKLLWQRIVQEWRQHALFKLATVLLLLVVLLALLADVLPLPYAPNQTDVANMYQPPFFSEGGRAGEGAHWLGADRLGRDVLANVVYGCRTGLLVSLPVMLLATLLGMLLGSLAGFFGDGGLRVQRGTVPVFVLFLFLCWYYGFYVRQAVLQEGSLVAEGGITLLVCLVLAGFSALFLKIVQKTPWGRRKRTLPVDSLVLRSVEVVTAVPRFILILCLSAFFRPSLQVLVVLAVLTYWAVPARLVRGEVLKVKELPFVESARVLGLPVRHMLLRHVLPNVLPPVLVSFAFGVAGLLALESTLSFLGVGLPADLPSWGRSITGIRQNTAAWWLVLFPGLALSATILSIQVCSHYVLKAIGKK